MRVLEEFNISNRILALTTDNDSAMLSCENEIAAAFNDDISSMNFSHYFSLSLCSTCTKFGSEERVADSW